jgi:hypothetical protein
VVIVTNGQIPTTDAGLIVVYGAAKIEHDRQLASDIKTNISSPSTFSYRNHSFSLYNKFISFELVEGAMPIINSNCGAIALTINKDERTICRIGYDLFREITHLITKGQPVEQANQPSLEVHVQILRDLMINSGVPFLEIPPVPFGFNFAVSLTHDIDFIGIKQHKFDHTLAGFLYRSLFQGLRHFLRGKIGIRRLIRMWKAVASLPLVHVGLIKDFWIPFEWYLQVEKGLNPTYFLIPFKGVPGKKVNAPNPQRRASPYDPSDISEWTRKLLQEGCEIGVHGLDAWHDAKSAQTELERIRLVTNTKDVGVRIHWLLRDDSTDKVLDSAGYLYDSTFGYNETIGYRAGTLQVYRPLSAKKLYQLPLHIQDGALFYPQRLGLSEKEAERRCARMIEEASFFGGVLTLLWHDRSHGPERFWGDFYRDLVGRLKTMPVWFASASAVVHWFEKRRKVAFNQSAEFLTVSSSAESNTPPLTVRVYNARSANQKPGVVKDISWSGQRDVVFSKFMNAIVSEDEPVLLTA